MLMRIRRYRVFLISAILLVTFIYQYSFSNEWDSVVPIVKELRRESEISHGSDPPDEPATKIQRPSHPEYPSPVQSPVQPPIHAALELQSTNSSSAVAHETVVAPAPAPIVSTKGSNSPKTVLELGIPDRKHAVTYAEQQTPFDRIHPLPPGRVDGEYKFGPPTATAIHWSQQPEHFPVPTESIIQLPSGKPIAIRKIQYEFQSESTEAETARLARREVIKYEARRAWESYKKFAWMHDELSPVSGKFRDPFCGWAATLVDSLDTLWIMGMIPEFEEAVEAVGQIDFTTSHRAEIPMFETTIRYLGGLLAAYDMSEGKYKVLLEKAAELGEILYSAFDTPNRMPVLYYQWKPTFASQPHRASTRAGTAELGSMAMEFTRLAQLTKEPRYYDAVARITNALEDFQNRGTGLPGVFPSDFDASGCNWTSPGIPEPVAEPIGYQAPSPAVSKETNTDGPSNVEEAGKLEFQATNDGVGLSKTRIQGWDENHPQNNKGGETVEAEGASKGSQLKRLRRQLTDPTLSIDTSPPPVHKSGADNALPGPYSSPQLNLPTTASTQSDWDCTPQGLVAATRQYSMGGGQDSTYEYFPKQYVLLGGLEDKYRTMYLKTIAAVRQHLLYRPMIPENRSLLFSGRVTLDTSGTEDLDAEVTHLTCFIGGMVGMAAKLFDIESDLEIAKRLTDGCVWAYETMPSGIMPENAKLSACESVNHCAWNETLYYETLDPNGAHRDQMRADYFRDKEQAAQAVAAAEAAKAEADRLDAAAQAAAEAKDAAMKAEADRLASAAKIAVDVKDDGSAGEATLLQKTAEEYKPMSEHQPIAEASKSEAGDSTHTLQKRQIDMDEETSLPITHDVVDEVSALPTTAKSQGSGEKDAIGIQQEKIPVIEKGLTKKLSPTEQELKDNQVNPHGNPSKSGQASSVDMSQLNSIPSTNTGQEPLLRVDPMAPKGHEEFVQEKIKNEALQSGFVMIENRKYILRPEAIESVWYMYRITGDTEWQEKGWRMWQSIKKHTRTEHAHSAISDVTKSEAGGSSQDDTMESFWLAETLKYFYLLFSEPELVSLDEWVLNTEAHPLRRPV